MAALFALCALSSVSAQTPSECVRSQVFRALAQVQIKTKGEPGGNLSTPWQLEANPSDHELAAIFKLVANSYRSIGMPIQSAEDLRKYTHLFVIREPSTGKISAMAGYKDQVAGAKSAIFASDGSAYTKISLKAMLMQMSDVYGWYAELSMTPAKIALSNPNARVVPFSEAEAALAPKTIRRPTESELEQAIQLKEIPDTKSARDGAYVRSILINGRATPVIKIMVGHPILNH
ncbi:MAG: hypothetical protein P4M08_12420 [Oligoflexia bacterium]|nr:hypothetical protein [Oligoflexia bacterium]